MIEYRTAHRSGLDPRKGEQQVDFYEKLDRRTKTAMGLLRWLAGLLGTIAIVIAAEGYFHAAATIVLGAGVLWLFTCQKLDAVNREEERRRAWEMANQEADDRREARTKLEAAHKAALAALEERIRQIQAGHAPELALKDLIIRDQEGTIAMLRETLAELGKEHPAFAAWQAAMADQARGFEAERASIVEGARAAADQAAAMQIDDLQRRVRELEDELISRPLTISFSAIRHRNGRPVGHVVVSLPVADQPN